MIKVFNSENIKLGYKQQPVEDFSWHSSKNLAEIAGAKHMRFHVRSLDPGKFSYPYHFHRNAEEIFVIQSGAATLRTVDGFRTVKEGDIVFCGMGPEGVHQLYNHTDQPCVFLDICTTVGLDVCEYPDSGKINVIPYGAIYKKQDQVNYFEGEEDVATKWKSLYKGERT